VLTAQEAGAKTHDLCRRHGISGTTFFKWKSKFGGMEASDAKRLRSLEDENRRLKKLLAEQMLDSIRPPSTAFRHRFISPSLTRLVVL
jgi:putative transposase